MSDNDLSVAILCAAQLITLRRLTENVYGSIISYIYNVINILKPILHAAQLIKNRPMFDKVTTTKFLNFYANSTSITCHPIMFSMHAASAVQLHD